MVNSRRIMHFFVFAVLVAFTGILAGYYYFEDFSSGSTGWVLNYKYGRKGINLNEYSNHDISVGGGALRFRGIIVSNQNAGWLYHGFWTGRMAYHTATGYTASVTNPFGVEFRRTYARLDPHGRTGPWNMPEGIDSIVAQSYWLISEDTYIDPATAAEYTVYDNKILMYEMMRMSYNTGSGQPRSTWGHYIGAESRFDLTTAVRPDGSTENLTTSATYGLEWNYDDHYGQGTTENVGDLTGGPGGTANPNANNNNPVIIRLTHDGSTVRFYINPNPDDDGSNPYPNEFLLVGSAGVSWHENIKFMTGMETKVLNSEFQNSDIDSVLVRSVASGITAEISPSRIARGSTNTYQIVVAPTFSANDAGIGEITIRKPAGYTAAWTPSAVDVYSFKGTGSAHTTLTTLKKMTYTGSVPASIGQAYITASGDTLKIRFFQGVASLTTAGVINSQTGTTADDKKIVVSFTMAAPDSANATGETFEVKADCVKYDGQFYPRWATTGAQKASPGDALLSSIGDTLSVKRFGDPDALATVSPDLIYIGANRTVYLYVATTNDNAPPVSELRIRVPDGYTVNTSDSSLFSSLYVVNDNQYVFATNVAGTDYIYVQYAADSGGYGLPSPGGLDRITIQVDSTPTGFTGPQTNTVWTATAYASVPGTTGTECGTNATYPNRNVVVRTLPPDVTGVVVSSLVEGGTNYLYNHTGSGTLTYIVNNNGLTGNTVKRLRVFLPATVTNADMITSTVMGGAAVINYVSSNNSFIIDYKAAGKSIASGGSDTITLTVFDNIVPMTGMSNGSFTLEADNENGDGYVSGSQGAGSWSVTWKNPPASANASLQVINSSSSGSTNIIPTTDTVSTIKVNIVNTGGSFNNIKLAAIDLPAQFTNVLSASSLKMQNSGTNISFSGGRVLVKYYENGIGSLQNTESDTITLQVADNTGLTGASTQTAAVSIANTTAESDLKASGLIPEASKSLTFRIPDATATGYVIPVEIDASTVTNTLQYTLVNTGAHDNYISEIRLYIPDSIASNLLDASSTHLASYPGNVIIDTSGFTNMVRILYQGASLLYGGDTDTVSFKLVDHIESATNFTVVAVASNVRNEWKTLGVTSGRTNRVTIEIPPASAAADISPNVLYTESSPTNRLLRIKLANQGVGGNHITNAVITFPAALQNHIQSVSNTKGAPFTVVNGSRTITFYYTNSYRLDAGQTDYIYIWFDNTVSSQLTDQPFTGTVDNGQGPRSIDALSSGSMNISFVDRPTARIYQSDTTPNQIYSTDSSSDFIYQVYNGTTGGKGIRYVLVDLPYPFVSTGIQVSPSWPGASFVVVTSNITALDGTVINSGGKEKILLGYLANDLDAGSSDEITMKIQDVLPQGETNVTFTTWVDYGDGYGFRRAAVAPSQSLDIQFVFPDASANASVSPLRVNVNSDTVLYSVTVTNTGVPGNHIKMLEITMPAVITNVSGLSSSIAGTVVSNQGNVLHVRYAPATNLLSGYSDVISFTGTDSVTSLTNYTVSVRVANSTNPVYYRSSGTISPDSLDLEYYRPDYIAASMIAPVTPVSGQPDTIYSTITTSTLEFTLVNNGAPGNDLTELKLYIPGSVFDASSFSGATSQRVPAGQIVRSGDVVTVYYTNTGQPLMANQSDVIRFVISDLVSYSNASSVWVSASKFTTSGSSYLTNQTVTGKSSSVNLVMPQPTGTASLGQSEVYTTSRTFTIPLSLSNAGSGSNALKRVYIRVPEIFRSGLSAASLTNSSASNVAYAGGMFTLTYSGLAAGGNDTVYLQLSNGAVVTSNVSFAVTADNGTYTNTLTEKTADSLKVKVVTPPSGYAEASVPKDGVYNRLYSTDAQNEIKVYIRNDGTGVSSVGRVRITAPSGFTMTAASSRIGGGFVVVNSNVAELDYAGGGSSIGVSETDTVTLQVTAPFVSGDTNVVFRMEMRDIDPNSLNGGYSEGRLYSGKSWQLAYHHPAPVSRHYISGYGAGTKPSIFVAPRNGIARTNISLTVNNTGVSSNLIHHVRITVPSLFSPLSNVASSHGGICLVTGNVVDVYYSNTVPLAPGSGDTVSIGEMYYSLADATNNLPFAVQTENGSSWGLTASSLSSGWFDTLDIKYPPLSVLAGVVNTASVYTIFTNTTLSYRIKNRAQGYRITKFVLTNFYAGIFTNVTFNSSKGAVCPGTNANGTAVLDYSAAQLEFNEVDTVSIGLTYKVDASLVTTLTLQGVVTLTNETLGTSTNIGASVLEAIDTDVNNADNQRIGFGPAPFGNLAGTILPRFKVDAQNPGQLLPNIVTVSVIGLTNSTVLTTPYKQESGASGGLVDSTLSVYSDSTDGRYSLTYVPAGSYRLRFQANGFRTIITNVTVVSNTVITVSNLVMRNDLLDSDSSKQQVVVDYNDTNTRFIVESGGLLDQFSLDIKVVDMNDPQEVYVRQGSDVKNVSSTSLLGCFEFSLYNNTGTLVEEQSLGGDATLVLHYASTGLNLPVPGDWQEGNLAIYYWKDSTKEWVPIGGQADQAANTITARVNYLHRYYAVMSVPDGAASKPIYNVTASPNPFTPGRGGEANSRLKLTFSLLTPTSSYTVTVYNMRGKKVKYYKRDGSLGQGEVFWDGTDENGFRLPGGVYIYQIRANGQVYSGSVLMVK